MITDETLISLRENDERFDNLFFYLDDFSFGDDGFDDNNNNDTPINNPNNELAQALRGNTRVVAVDVDMHLDEPMNRHVEGLMTGIGQLQNLQSLRCSSSGDYAVTMAALTHTLVASQQKTSSAIESGNNSNATNNELVSLDLANFLLQKKQDCDEHSLAVTSYHDFVTALRHHPTLERFHLGFGFSSSASASVIPPSTAATATASSLVVSAEDTSRTAHYCLTPLLESLMTLPSLDSIRLDGAGFASPAYLTPEGLAAALDGTANASSSPVTILELSDFDLSTAHIEAVAKALEANTSNLKVLSLSCTSFVSTAALDEGRTGVVSLAQAVRNNTRLESLTLPLQSLLVKNSGQAPNKKTQNKDKDANCKAVIEFFEALEVNYTLKRLQLNGSDDEATLTAIDDVLTSPDVMGAFRHMLQHNYGLESLYLGYPQVFSEGDWQAEINLYTKLNSMGRGRLVRDASITRDQWMESFGAVQDDLSCLFHLLHLNPLLCGGSSTRKQDHICLLRNLK